MQANVIAIRQEDRWKYIYFIKSGVFKVMREVKFVRDIDPSKRNRVENFYKDPTEEDFDNYNICSKLLEIDHLERFNWFGDRNLPPEKEEDEYEPFTVISAIPSEVYLVDRKVFLELLPKEYSFQFKSYPNDYKLRKRYFEQKNHGNHLKEKFSKKLFLIQS